MIGDGAELLLLVPSLAGLVGSCVLPVLGAVPDGETKKGQADRSHARIIRHAEPMVTRRASYHP